MKRLILLPAAVVLIAVFLLGENDLVRGAAGLIFIFVWIPVLVVTTIDLLREARSATGTPAPLRVLAGVPEALLGLLSVTIGATIIAWVLYNLLVERRPEYPEPSPLALLSPFGVGAPLVAVGFYWLWRAFSRSPDEMPGS